MWSIGSAAPDYPYAAPQSWVTYNGNNQVNATTQMPAGFQYDTSGRVTGDGGNTYTYDAEGRITAVSQVGGLFRATLYIYDAEGRRVAKAFPTGIVPAVVTPDFLHSGAAVSTQYILGKDGEEVSQLDGSGDWLQSNAYYGGQLLATITPDDTLFSLNDWLGTKRVTVGASLCGTAYTQFPFGDGLVANPLVVNGATLTACEEVDGHHFTGKERDNESGNDYFGARYYKNGMGRFISPDLKAASGKPVNPQSWNRYNYTDNNPLAFIDPDGKEKITFTITATVPYAQTKAVPWGATYSEGQKSVTTFTVDTQARNAQSVFVPNASGQPVSEQINPTHITYRDGSTDDKTAAKSATAKAFGGGVTGIVGGEVSEDEKNPFINQTFGAGIGVDMHFYIANDTIQGDISSTRFPSINVTATHEDGSTEDVYDSQPTHNALSLLLWFWTPDKQFSVKGADCVGGGPC